MQKEEKTMDRPMPENNHYGTSSSIFEKLDAARRQKIDRAVANRDPVTFRAIFEKFKLAEAGVSYSAFYRYARKIRDQADQQILLDDEFCPGADVPAMLLNQVARQFAAMMLHENPTPLMTQRMVNAYTKALQFKAVIAVAAAT